MALNRGMLIYWVVLIAHLNSGFSLPPRHGHVHHMLQKTFRNSPMGSLVPLLQGKLEERELSPLVIAQYGGGLDYDDLGSDINGHEPNKRQFDDYGHLRFGKRDEFDDYGHLRFGRASKNNKSVKK